MDWNWLSGGLDEARGRVADLGVRGDVDQVAARRQLSSSRQAIAVHLGDDGLGEVPDPEPAVDDVARPLARAARGEYGWSTALFALRS